MASERQGSELVFYCDKCSEYIETEESEWSVAWGMARRDGWQALRVGAEYIHYCPSCTKKT